MDKGVQLGGFYETVRQKETNEKKLKADA